jgi:hypothetical protein
LSETDNFFPCNNTTGLKVTVSFIRFSELIWILLLFCCPLSSYSQDNHYWAQQYGATGTLIGGAMTAGVTDNSAIYYNPGILGFIENLSLSVDANVYKMDKILIADGAGKDMNLNSAQLSVYPQIIAGMLNIFKESRFRFSYTMLTRNHGNILMNARYTSDPSSGGNAAVTSFIGGFDYVNQLTEQWFGIGAGYRLTEKLGAGATVFATYRGQSYQLNNYVQEVEEIDMHNVFRTQTIDEAIKYSNYQLITKIGLSYTSGILKIGATITTPSVRLFGSGNVQRENSNIAVSEFPEDMVNNFIIMDRKTGERALYKHPLSVAAGIEYCSDLTRLSFSAEYFFRTDPYYLLKPASIPFVYPASYLDSAAYKPLIDNYMYVEVATKSVLNTGIGYSRKVFEKLTILLGASTDFSSWKETDETNELLSGFGDFDIYHLSAGASYDLQRQSITLGFTYAFSPSENIPPYTVINQGPAADEANLSYASYAVILGYTYFFSRTGE